MKKKLIVLTIFSFALIGAIVFSYDNVVAHPSFSARVVDIYNAQFGGNISAVQKESIVKGSINEDETPRYMNHFYDPTTGKGIDSPPLKGKTAKEWASNQFGVGGDFSIPTILEMYKQGETERAYEGVGHIMHLVQDMAVPAHTRNDPHGNGDPYEGWTRDNVSLNNIVISEIPNLEIRQIFDELARYTHDGFLSADSFSKEILAQNISDYQTIDKFLPSKSRYVKYLVQNNHLLISVSDDLSPVLDFDNNVHSSYYQILSPQAIKYSMSVLQYFQREFAKIDAERQAETLSKWQAIKLAISRAGDDIKYGMWSMTAKAEFAGIETFVFIKDIAVESAIAVKNFAVDTAIAVKNFTIKVAVTVKDFTVSSAQAIANATKSAIDKINSIFSTNTQIQMAGPITSADVSSQSPEILTVSAPSNSTTPTQGAEQAVAEPPQPTTVVGYSNTADLLQQLAEAKANLEALQVQTPTPQQIPPVQDVRSSVSNISQTTVWIGYGFGGGGAPSTSFPPNSEQVGTSNEQTNSNDQNSEPESETTPTPDEPKATTTPETPDEPEVPVPPADTTAPSAPVIISPADFSAQFATTTIIFAGTAEASSTISTDLAGAGTTTADVAGAWSLALNFNQATTTINFYATDEANNISSSTSATIFVDSIAPDVTLAVAECANSIAVDSAICLTPLLTIHAEWSSTDANLDYYEVASRSLGEMGQAIITTDTATTTNAVFADEWDYDDSFSFSIRAKDKAGNWSATSTQEVAINKMPVVINEIAWAGTKASSTDEWIELYNRTNYNINLNNFVLRSETDGSPYINLLGGIASENYFLIERKTEDKLSSQIFDYDRNPLADLLTSFSYGLKNDPGEILMFEFAPAGIATTTVDQTTLWEDGDWIAGTGAPKCKTMERVSSDKRGDDADNWETNTGFYNSMDASNNTIYGTPKAKNSASYKDEGVF